MRPTKPKVLHRTCLAVVHQNLGYGGAGCHGTQGLEEMDAAGHRHAITIPGWDLPPDTTVTIAITVTVIQLGQRSSKRCENPWPAHLCSDGVHRGAHGQLLRSCHACHKPLTGRLVARRHQGQDLMVHQRCRQRPIAG
jgi:hypothetical protein